MELKTAYRVCIIILSLLLMALLLTAFTMLRTEGAQIQQAIEELLQPEPKPTPTPLPSATPEPTPMPTPEPTPEPTPALRERTELLVLVNPWHELPEDYTVELQQVTWEEEENQYMDVRCADALLQMVWTAGTRVTLPISVPVTVPWKSSSIFSTIRLPALWQRAWTPLRPRLLRP